MGSEGFFDWIISTWVPSPEEEAERSYLERLALGNECIIAGIINFGPAKTLVTLSAGLNSEMLSTFIFRASYF